MRRIIKTKHFKKSVCWLILGVLLFQSLGFLFLPKNVSAQDPLKEFLRKKLEKQLEANLKDKLPGWLKKTIADKSSEILATTTRDVLLEIFSLKDLVALQNAYLTALNTKLKFFLGPELNKLLAKKLIDFVPDETADHLNLLNDQLKWLTDEGLGIWLTGQLTDLTRDIFLKVGKALGIGEGFLEVFIEAVNIVIADITSEYLLIHFIEPLDIDKFQMKLESWLTLTVEDILPRKIQEDLEKTYLDYVKEKAPKFAKILEGINNILTTIIEILRGEEGLREIVRKTTGQKVKDILFAEITELLNKTVYEILLMTRAGKILETRIVDLLPPEFRQSFYSLLPELIWAKFVDLLPPPFNEIKNKSLLELLPEEVQVCLTVPWRDLSPSQRERCSELFSKSYLDLVGDFAVIFTKGLLDFAPPKVRAFLGQTPKQSVPGPYKTTPYQLLGIDYPETTVNEARTQQIYNYDPSLKILVQLFQKYIPKPGDFTKSFLMVVGYTPYQFIASSSNPLVPPSFTPADLSQPISYGLGRPDIAEGLDTSLVDLLIGFLFKNNPNDPLAKFLTEGSWLDKLTDLIRKSLKSNLAERNPNFYQVVSTDLWEQITENKPVVNLIAEKLEDPSIIQKFQTKLIDLNYFSSLGSLCAVDNLDSTFCNLVNNSFIELIESWGICFTSNWYDLPSISQQNCLRILNGNLLDLIEKNKRAILSTTTLSNILKPNSLVTKETLLTRLRSNGFNPDQSLLTNLITKDIGLYQAATQNLWDLITEGKSWLDLMEEKNPSVQKLRKKTFDLPEFSVLNLRIFDLLPAKLRASDSSIVDLLRPDYQNLIKNYSLIWLMLRKNNCLTNPANWAELSDPEKQSCLSLLNNKNLLETMGTDADVFTKKVKEILTSEERGIFESLGINIDVQSLLDYLAKVEPKLYQALNGNLRDLIFEGETLKSLIIKQKSLRNSDLARKLNTKLVDLPEFSFLNYLISKNYFSADFTNLLKNNSLIDLISSSQGLIDFMGVDCFATPWTTLLPSQQRNCLGVFNINLLSAMGRNGKFLSRPISEFRNPENLFEGSIDPVEAKVLGINLNQSLLDYLITKGSTTLELYQIIREKKLWELTMERKEPIYSMEIKEPIYFFVDIIAQKLGDLSIISKFQTKLIDLPAFSFFNFGVSFLARSLFDLLPDDVKDILSKNLGGEIKDKFPFDKTIYELLPPKFNDTLEDFFGLNIEQAINKALDKTKKILGEIPPVQKIERIYQRNQERIAAQISQTFLKAYIKLSGQKIDEAKAEEIQKKMGEKLAPLYRRAVTERLRKGYMLNSLKELY
ncbi:MAG: hypothetical protein QMC93_00325 [Patescibacteria group bacterium]|nr:hypothetical protein [Patescibacteria group bacterium]